MTSRSYVHVDPATGVADPDDLGTGADGSGDNVLHDDGTWAAESGGSGAPATADYLTGTAQAGLSAEIVVGTSPGGELGGTWASPTIDTTHSGSSHTGAASAAVSTHEAASDPHTGYQRESEKDANSGYAGLNSSGIVPIAHLASGTPDGTKFLRDDNTLGVPSGSGAPSDADYLVGTANGGLSAEIAVGTTPGGELGGTWASPTVDTTHSGSAHPTHTTLGYATAGASFKTARGGYMTQITIPSGGRFLTAIRAYVKGNGANAILVSPFIFDDNGSNVPQNLVMLPLTPVVTATPTRNDQAELNTTGRWVTFPVGAWFAGGTVLWIGVWLFSSADSQVQLAFDATGGTSYTQSAAGFNWPTDKSLDAAHFASSTDKLSIYADMLGIS